MSTLSLGMLLALVGGVAADDQATTYQTHRDLSYVRPADSQRSLDVYHPTDGADLPIAVWIHGGGWQRGDKANVFHKPAAFTAHGFVLVSVGYRFVPHVTVADQAGDIAAAIRWVHDHATEYGGDPNRIVVLGHSAGAHLAALVATDPRYLNGAGLELSLLDGCIPVDVGAYDVVDRIQSLGPGGSKMYRTVFTESEATQRELSPLEYVARDAGIPPFLILHVADREATREQSHRFAKALDAAGVDATVVAGENKTHATINRELGLPDDPPTKAVFEFLERAVGVGASSPAASN